MQHYRLQEWLAFLNSEVHKGCGLLFNPVSDDTKKLVLEYLSGRLAYLDERLQGTEYLMGVLRKPCM